ncbi:hypothetical protein OE88DRAFT_1655141 [Heliocybe sulcata]|uniref:RING-type domain-containing protein n=1 Tax=Heliocybe sulcata TaxID=5364 RepID=A0A5C3NEJ8_9AGAM|nr:hypothetical protein OE88DRAFT_1655141 [Heliocybe sulcata]
MSWNNETTTTPWIALVACDNNATNASQVDDIFTLARDRGATAALLYSESSQACVINPDYANPENFEQVMDIFSTQSLTSAKLIEYQFSTSTVNKTIYGNYNASLLNASAAIINNTINTGTMNVSSYIFAELKAYNATGSGSVDGSANTDPSTSSSSGSTGAAGRSNSSLAMIVLYAITGCVSALFCVVIITGAVRAIRHPERYGPRNSNSDGRGSGSQSRAQGLTRAILDTFPVVKFGRTEGQDGSRDTDAKDIELGGTLPALPKEGHEAESAVDKDTAEEHRVERSEGGHEVRFALEDEEGEEAEASTSRAVPVRRPSGRARPAEDVVPDVIGRETCPICILDFEEGDDLRILPCEGKHKFHQQCVDPWLLELSSSCPICRHDFQALTTMMQGEGEAEGPAHDFHQNHRDSAGGGNRFSRYLRSAIRRRRYREEAAGYDPTDPYMPYAPETGL